MKKIFFLFIVAFSNLLLGQGVTVSPQVLNSAGNSHPNNSNGIYITDNVGEPFTQMINSNNIIITQGYLQPLSVIGATAIIIHNDVFCADKKDGNISVSLSNLLPNPKIEYVWTPSVICPTGNCANVDSLAAGSYSLKIIISYTINGSVKSDTLRPTPTLIKDVNGPCKIKVFNGVTANGDNNNDVWQIDNITEFPNNEVQIFNRWGEKIFEVKGYDNTTKFWPSKEDANKLAASTYFYVIKLGNGSGSIKGWVELIKN
jgi:gliding motility-associated-like protein